MLHWRTDPASGLHACNGKFAKNGLVIFSALALSLAVDFKTVLFVWRFSSRSGRIAGLGIFAHNGLLGLAPPSPQAWLWFAHSQVKLSP